MGAAPPGVGLGRRQDRERSTPIPTLRYYPPSFPIARARLELGVQPVHPNPPFSRDLDLKGQELRNGKVPSTQGTLYPYWEPRVKTGRVGPGSSGGAPERFPLPNHAPRSSHLAPIYDACLWLDWRGSWQTTGGFPYDNPSFSLQTV